uniref:Poliovirus receptor n=1 Tax=Phallusia mammillata TaxID=59560 RepID=A0A6F9DQQ9_9ASCI|nr:poliovirus receptor [Phallusia mammillata]
MVVQGNFTVTPDHNGRNVSCILALKNEAFVTSEKKLIKVNYGPTILNVTVVGFERKNGNSYKFPNNITLTIQCIVDSNPPSKCTWYNWDTKLTEVSPNCNLMTSFNSTSSISCHASNGFGSTAVETIHIMLGSNSNFPFSTIPVQYRSTNLQEKQTTQLKTITTKTTETQAGKNDPQSGPLHALLIGFMVLISIVIVVLVVACMRK